MEYTEVLDKQITRKQHYVPKAYLKNFSVSNQKSEQVYVVFANDENAKMVSIDNICCRSFLYDQIAIDPDSKTHVFAAPNEIENSFIELEGEYATIISKIKNALRDSDEFELARAFPFAQERPPPGCGAMRNVLYPPSVASIPRIRL